MFGDITSMRVTKLFISSESLREEQLLQQQQDAHTNLRAEASILASQISTQLNAEFRVMEHDTSAKKDRVLHNPDAVRSSS